MADALARKIAIFPVSGGPPASIAYLHKLAEWGNGNVYCGQSVTINITPADWNREPGLKNVESVTLYYRSLQQ